MRQSTFIGLLASVAGATAGTIPSDEVPILGLSFLSNFDPTDSQYIRNASETFPDVIDALFEAKILNKTDLVFAVDVFSAATNKSLYSYFHVGDDGKGALTTELDENTIGRVGSVSKLFTVYALLAKAGIEVFSHPVTRYIPELLGNSSGDPLEHVHWEDITVGALASQQAGSGGAVGAIPGTTQEELLAVSPEDLFTYMRDAKHPVSSPFRNALYSDGGFALLGQVIARITGQSYADAVRDALLTPLGLNSTSVGPPASSADLNAINRTRITETSLFDVPLPIVEASGGLYSSVADLRALGLSILNSELLSAATTSQWMKPLSGTGSLIEMVGAPWEITRLAIPATPGSNRTRISDLYTKAGGSKDYTSIIALSPDQGIGFSILIGGETAGGARWPIRDALGELFIPAAEAAAAENAEKNLAGVFEASEGSNITLTYDEGHPGLGVESVYLEGKESTSLIAGEDGAARMFPTGLYSNSRSLYALYNTKGTFRASHRANAYGSPPAPRAASEGGDGGLFDNQLSWLNLGFLDGLDEFIFTINDGKLTSVESVGAGLSFKRVE